MNLQAEVSRGVEAQQLIDNQLLNDALKAIEDEVIVQWRNCKSHEKTEKEALWQLFKTSQKFQNLLVGYVQTGKLATAELKRYEKESLMRQAARKLRIA